MKHLSERYRLPAVTAFAIVLGTLMLSSCDGMLSVNNPTNIADEDLDDPTLIGALAATPEGAVSLGYDHAIVYAEVVGDAGFQASTQTESLKLDQGDIEGYNERYELVYNQLASGRWLADYMTERVEALVTNPDTDLRVASGYFWSAIARITLADLFEEVPYDGGPPLPPAEVYEEAIDRLSTAAEVALKAGDTNLAAAAYSSIARAYRSLYFERGKQFADFQLAFDFADLALRTMPNFHTVVRYQTPGSFNEVFSVYSTGRVVDSMDPRYANQIDPVSGQRDLRIQHGPHLGQAANGRDVYEQSKYSSRDADIPVSRWQEASLIRAEYYLLSGDIERSADEINDVREVAGLPPFAPAGIAEAFGQLQYERATEFWLELRRWQDMRYYGIIPPEWTDDNKAKGVDRRWPVSQQEIGSNPHY